MTPPNRCRLRNDRGSESVELAIQMGLWVLFIGVIIAGGRIATADHAVETAAADAARSASISRTAAEARTSAIASARTTLAKQGLPCRTTTVTLDTSGFRTPVGQPAKVTATITCVVKLSDIAVPGLPGSYTATKTISSPIDTYRERR